MTAVVGAIALLSGREIAPPATGTLAGRAAEAPVRSCAPILVVDDDDSIRDMVSSVLREAGYTVREASDGAAGLRAVQTERPALILLDLRMPKVDGWEFAQRLRESGTEIPIVVMTAVHDARRAAESMKAVDHLPKPFDIDDLLALVVRHAATRRN